MGYVRTYVPRLLLAACFASWLAYIAVLILYIEGVHADDLFRPMLFLAGCTAGEFVFFPRLLGLFAACLYAATITAAAWFWMASESASIPVMQLALVGLLFLIGKCRFLCIWDQEKKFR